MEMHISPPSAEKAKERMVKFQHDSDQSFDPRGSIFLPKTEYPMREFSEWEFSILARRGELFPNITSDTETFAYQCELYEEFCGVRSWYLGKLATETLIAE